MKIEMQDDRKINLTSLYQGAIYTGLLEGLPTRRMNERIIHSYQEKARELFPKSPVFLIEPSQTPIEYHRDYPFGDPASLPPIACVARFKSSAFDNNVLCYTELAIVWFQSEFALPIDDHILQKIKNINWVKHAAEYDV
jgi:hypothetical protein